MKTLVSLLLILFSTAAVAQSVPYKVVFDLTSKDPANHQAVVRQAKSILDGRPDAQLEVAIYSEALPFVCAEKSTVKPEVEALLKTGRMKFKVCGETMKRKQVNTSELITGVEVVPDAIYEILTRQKEGWGYIKVAQ
ncbi:DsrE family protein [Chitinophaga deserti]|uniref:DsrE family protein n=1 Tax=Chitinophaga deserti TaxID=2164099 RepID=UPI000D6D84A9|nr:DsrE family protein [Chitinophaga deserti]